MEVDFVFFMTLLIMSKIPLQDHSSLGAQADEGGNVD